MQFIKSLFCPLIAILSFWMYEKWADNWGVKLAVLAGYMLLVAGMEWKNIRGLVQKQS